MFFIIFPAMQANPGICDILWIYLTHDFGKSKIKQEEKLMKKASRKRALMSALAMLIVSAISLSSATFAWFSSGNAVGVDQIEATVSNSDGSILISATGVGDTWKTQISRADLEAVTTNLLPTTLIPVSATLSKNQFIAGSITDTVFKATGDANSGFVKYTVFIKATTATTVDITPTFNSTVAFVYGGVVQDTNRLLLNANAGRSYYPIDDPSLIATDGNTNDIIDASEATAGALGSVQTATQATGTIQLEMAEGTVYPINVYVWAEGQDAACRGVVLPSTSSLVLTIVKQ